MGMFDWFRSSRPLGEHFTDTLCQTKDIEPDIGGTMTLYWLDPRGRLWYPEYLNTHTFHVFEEGDPEYDPKFKWQNYEWVKTGKHGRYQPCRITNDIVIYPATWPGDWKDWPHLRLMFVKGVLQYIEPMPERTDF